MDFFTIRVKGTDKIAVIDSSVDGPGEYCYPVHKLYFVPLSDVNVFWVTTNFDIATKALKPNDYWGSEDYHPYHTEDPDSLEVVSLVDLMSLDTDD